jgi:hypothetical protein
VPSALTLGLAVVKKTSVRSKDDVTLTEWALSCWFVPNKNLSTDAFRIHKRSD